MSLTKADLERFLDLTYEKRPRVLKLRRWRISIWKEVA